MSKQKKANALQSLKEEMNVHTQVPTDINAYERHDTPPPSKSSEALPTKKKPRSREVSNIPWYPKSKKLKHELKLLALHEETTLTGLIDEGISLVLERRGKNIKDYI